MAITRISTLDKIDDYESQYNTLTNSELDDIFEKWSDFNCKSITLAEDMMHRSREIGGEKSRLGNMYEGQSDMLSAMMNVIEDDFCMMNFVDEFNLSDFIRGEGEFYRQCRRTLTNKNPRKFCEQNKNDSFVDGWYIGFEMGISNLLSAICECIDEWIEESIDYDHESMMAYGENWD